MAVAHRTDLPRISTRAAVSLRDRLRAARATSVADAEGYNELIVAIEEVGRFVTARPGAHGLGHYSSALLALAHHASVDTSRFPSLLDALREARNDAAHLGAAARRTVTQATEVALVLEDALVNHAKLKLVEHYMVESPVCAEPWQSVAMVRRIMLSSQFSVLPLQKGKVWHLLTDAAVVRFLSSDRDDRLNMTIEEALHCAPRPLETEVAHTALMGALAELLKSENLKPHLVVDKDANLRGILTPFDLL